jgi:CheY-like chemotaxis protein
MNTMVMVVDDELDVEALFRQQFRRELRDGAFVMIFALSATAALEQLAVADASKVILVLSDINMPGMNGLDLLARLKSDRPDLPVVMVTAYGASDTRRQAAERGADGLLTKPVDFSALRAEIGARVASRLTNPMATP